MGEREQVGLSLSVQTPADASSPGDALAGSAWLRRLLRTVSRAPPLECQYQNTYTEIAVPDPAATAAGLGSVKESRHSGFPLAAELLRTVPSRASSPGRAVRSLFRSGKERF
jgi:hypothetical protein